MSSGGGQHPYDNEEYENDGRIMVPVGQTRQSKVRDRRGQMSLRESTVMKLRACHRCHLVMSEEQFMDNGCLNCPDLQLDNNLEAVRAYTTNHFQGLLVVMRARESWVAKFNNFGNYSAGAYAISTQAGQSQY